MYVLHIGVKPEHVGDIYRLFPTLTIIDGDGWNSWGEPFGTESNDADTYHVVIGPFGGLNLAERIAEYLIDMDDEDKTRGENILVPMGGPARQSGVRVCISDDNAWSENQTDYR